MSDDVEELLKTSPVRATESLTNEVNNKWKAACDAVQVAEENAATMKSLLDEVRSRCKSGL